MLLLAQSLAAAQTVATRLSGKPILEQEVRNWIERDREKGRLTSRSEALGLPKAKIEITAAP